MRGSSFNSSKGPDRRPWRFDLVLDDSAPVPRQIQLARAIILEIQRGRLAPGAMLPGSRTLATQLGVNRKVVVAAVEELVAQGWLETLPARGTRVALHLPVLPVGDAFRRRVEPPLSRIRPAERVVQIDDGAPDVRVAPLAALARAQRRALQSLARAGLAYGDPAGDPVLREVLSAFVNHARGLACAPDELLLTRGSQGALSLVALSLLQKGDVVAVEKPGYAPAWRAFELAGARVLHVDTDASGLRTDQLEARARRLGRLRAVYVTPHHQYPTTVALSPDRRMHLRQICSAYGAYLIEDDYDYEYHFEGTPLLPICASTSRDDTGIYIASLSKLIAPALRLGYVIASRQTIDRLCATRETLDRQGDVVLERAMAELLEDGELQRHARRARQIYLERRNHLLERLATHPILRDELSWTVPAGGIALWVRLNTADVDALAERMRHCGVRILAGSAHLPRGHLSAFRFGFASHTPRELTGLCDTLASCLSALTRRGS